MRIADGLHLPDEFDLLIPLVDGLEQRCRVHSVWRRGGAVGGAFLSIGGLAADTGKAGDHPRLVGPAMDAAIEDGR